MTSRIFAAHAGGDDWRASLDRAFEGLGEAGRRARLGFCYVTDTFSGDASALPAELRARSGIEHWIGTVGAGVCADGTEYFDTPAVSLMTMDLPADSFRIFRARAADLSDLNPALEAWIERAGCGFGVVHGDPMNPHLELMLSSLNALAGGVFFVGGLSSSRRQHFQIADGHFENGVSGVCFGAGVAVTTRLTQGCSPIGPRHAVTRATGSIISELDGRPALEVFAEEIAAIGGIRPHQLGGYVYVALPVKGSDTGDYVVRNLIGVDPDNSALAVGDTLDDAEYLMFCKRDAEAAEEDLNGMLDRITEGVASAPRGAVYFSCVARGPNLFGPASREMRLIQRRIGALPLTGFFGNGEISSHRLYGYTGVLTLFL
jgi:small ligand-binding sensory domain FIST